MYIGIDFGISYFVVVVVLDGRLQLIYFGDVIQFCMVVFFFEWVFNLNDFQLMCVMEVEVDVIVYVGCMQYYGLLDVQFCKDVICVVCCQWMEDQVCLVCFVMDDFQ